MVKIEIDRIPGDPLKLTLKIPRLSYIIHLVERIPGIEVEEEESTKFIEPWKRVVTPVNATMPCSQAPMLSIITTHYPIELVFYNGAKDFVMNPPPDLTVDKVDDETISLFGLFRQKHYSNNLQQIAERKSDYLFHVPVKLYIAGIKYAEDDICRSYDRYSDFRPSIHCTQEAIDVIEYYKRDLERFRKGEHLSRGDVAELQLKRPLRDYQKTAVDFLEYNRGCGLIADEMGLGKTMVAISYADLIKANRILVVCPANVKYTWQEEILLTSLNPGKIKILEGRKEKHKQNTKLIGNERWAIINYDILLYRIKELKNFPWDLIVFDESHYIKNYDAKRTKASRELFAPNRIALTGTPILNRAEEFWTTLSWLNPEEWGKDHYAFREFKCRYGENFYGVSKEEFLMELNGRLKNVMLRRLKSEVEDLPQKIRQVRHVALHSQEMIAYRKKEKEIWEQIQPLLAQIDAKRQQAILMALQTLRRYASLAKTPLTMEVLREVLEGGGKVVVFSEFLKSLDALENVVNKEKYKTFRIDGSIRGEQRHEQVSGFQNHDGPAVFLGQIRASGIGITLTASSTVVFNDFAWNTATHRQAEDRIHRIGQKECCTIIFVSAKDTIDEQIVGILLKKIDVISTVLDEKEDISEALNNVLDKFREGGSN